MVSKKRKVQVNPGYDREPVHPGEVTKLDMIDALNWYAYSWEGKKSIKALIEHFRSRGDKDTVRVLRGVNDKLIHPTFCHVARMMDNGSVFPDKIVSRFNDHVSELVEIYNSTKEDEEENVEKPTITVQDRVQAQVDVITEDIDKVIDDFIESGYKDQKFRCYTWLDRKGIKPVHARKVADIYRPMLEELNEALTDEELAEGYSKMKKADLKRFIKMIENIIDDCETWAENRTKTRVPKKRKPRSRPIIKQVEKLKYKKEDGDLKVASITPERIVGSQQVWLYNVKNKKLTRLDAMNRDGFTVSGTTIKGFDPDVSTAKSVRKPKETLPRVLEGGKIVLRKLMDELTTKDQEPKGRTNDDTIILRIE